MGKIVLFSLFVLGIVIYPFFTGDKFKAIKVENMNLPFAEIKSGSFIVYEDNKLAKKGNFKEAKIFDSYYKVFDLNLTDLIKKYQFFGRDNFIKTDFIISKDAKYRDDTIEIISDEAFYNRKNKILTGEDFHFFTQDAKGEGSSFVVYPNKRVTAVNIQYVLKVDK